MPSALHPRSMTTLSLFTTTLALSFVVVALPHVIPCPVPHNRMRLYAEGKSSEMDSQQPRSARRRKNSQIDERECPVPKPSGLVGKILGFKPNNREKPMAVKIIASSKS